LEGQEASKCAKGDCALGEVRAAAGKWALLELPPGVGSCSAKRDYHDDKGG